MFSHFHIPNHGKFWSILLGHFMKHKASTSEKCIWDISYGTFLSVAMYIVYLGMPLGLCTVDGHPFKSFHCIDKPPTSDRYISIFTTIQYRAQSHTYLHTYTIPNSNSCITVLLCNMQCILFCSEYIQRSNWIKHMLYYKLPTIHLQCKKE